MNGGRNIDIQSTAPILQTKKLRRRERGYVNSPESHSCQWQYSDAGGLALESEGSPTVLSPRESGCPLPWERRCPTGNPNSIQCWRQWGHRERESREGRCSQDVWRKTSTVWQQEEKEFPA